MQETEGIEGIDFSGRSLEVSLTAQLKEGVGKEHRSWCQYVREGRRRQEVEQRLLVKLIKFTSLEFELQVAAPRNWNVLLNAICQLVDDGIEPDVVKQGVADHEEIAEEPCSRSQRPAGGHVRQHTKDHVVTT